MALVNSTLRSVVAYLEKRAPLELAESWDNVGLLIEPPTGDKTPVAGIMLTNDLTEPVLHEAISQPSPGVQLILSYHPPIFKPLPRITTRTWQGRILSRCLANGISVYSPHTTWDNSVGCITDFLLSPLSPECDGDVSPLNKSGRQCGLKVPLSLSEIVDRYKTFTGLQRVRFVLASNATMKSKCKSVAVCAGSGAGVLSETAGECDIWITGEMSHHDLLNAQQSGTSVLLLEHSNSERMYLTQYQEELRAEFPNLNVFVSTADNDPVYIV